MLRQLLHACDQKCLKNEGERVCSMCSLSTIAASDNFTFTVTYKAVYHNVHVTSLLPMSCQYVIHVT